MSSTIFYNLTILLSALCLHFLKCNVYIELIRTEIKLPTFLAQISNEFLIANCKINSDMKCIRRDRHEFSTVHFCMHFLQRKLKYENIYNVSLYKLI